MQQVELSVCEVRFDKYCRECKNWPINEYMDPCNECLDVPFRVDTRKPLYFEDKSNKSSQEKHPL